MSTIGWAIIAGFACFCLGYFAGATLIKRSKEQQEESEEEKARREMHKVVLTIMPRIVDLIVSGNAHLLRTERPCELKHFKECTVCTEYLLNLQGLTPGM